MKKLLRYRGFFVALLLGVALALPFFNKQVYATELPTIILDSSRGIDSLQSDINSISNKLGKFKYMTYKSGENNTIEVRLNTVAYNSLTQTDKRELMTKVLAKIQDSNLQTKERTRLYNFVCKQDTTTSAVTRQLSENVNADYVRAWVWFKPFSGGLSTALGVGTLLISALLTLSTLADLSWLGIPWLQLLGGNSSGTKPKWISNEAWVALQESEASNSKKDTMLLYAGKRTKAWFVLFICLLYLLNGQIFDFIGWAMDTINTMFFE
jgi:hypothetical protein